MIHLIIIFHFLCLAAGAGFITYGFIRYRESKSEILKKIIIVEILFSIMFLSDTLKVYVIRIIDMKSVKPVFTLFIYVISIVAVFLIIKTGFSIYKDKLYRNFGRIEAALASAIALVIILMTLSSWIKVLQGIPLMCLLYLLQCALGVIFSCYRKTENKLKDLTERESEIVEYIVMGLSNKEIGEKLFISPNTVKNHIYNIYKKTHVKNKVELINLVNSRD